MNLKKPYSLLLNSYPGSPANDSMSILVCLYRHDHCTKLTDNPVQSQVKWFMEKQSTGLSLLLLQFCEFSLKVLGNNNISDRHPKYLPLASAFRPLLMGKRVFTWPITSPWHFLYSSYMEDTNSFQPGVSILGFLLICFSYARWVIAEVMVFRCLPVSCGCFYNLSWDKVSILPGSIANGKLKTILFEPWSMEKADEYLDNVLINHSSPQKTIIKKWYSLIKTGLARLSLIISLGFLPYHCPKWLEEHIFWLNL